MLFPIVRKSTNNRDIEITAEDEQQFLLRQQQYLQQGNPTAGKYLFIVKSIIILNLRLCCTVGQKFLKNLAQKTRQIK